MEVFVSAVLGEMATRAVTFLISMISEPPASGVEYHHARVLLRAQVIVDEAMGRHITNRGMRLQLNMLRDNMHRGYYTLDTFRYQSHKEEGTKDRHLVNHSSSPLKGFCFFSSRNTQVLKQMEEVFNDWSAMILDVEGLVMFLTSCPRMCRQPYSMHIMLGNYMFGRQMEAQLVVSFLLHTQQPHGAEELEVLPIVGPGRVGKSTLVAHVCNDERIRDHFSNIVFLRDRDCRDDEWLSVLDEGCAIERQSYYASKKDRRLLIVVELANEDINDDAWKKLCSASKRCATTSITKIIITSRSDKITRLGTTRAITLKYLSTEACWYFFKTLTFGSTDPQKHPRLACVAMELAKMLKGNLVGANIDSCLLRDNFDNRFWCKVLAFKRRLVQNHLSRFDEHPSDLLNQNGPVHLGRMVRASEDFIVYGQHQRSLQEVVPKVRIQDVMYGSVRPQVKFELLAWRSRIPPYHSYVYTCEVREMKTIAAKRKCSV